MNGFLGKLKKGLSKTRQGVFGKVSLLFSGSGKLDEELLEEVEEILIQGDVGVETTLYLIDRVRERARREKLDSREEAGKIFKEEIQNILLTPSFENTHEKPFVILMVGVNGTGKTTSIAKLAHYYKQQGKKVLLAAADTFRAAAIEQLSIWAKRVGCDVIKHQSGADPSAVVFDAITAAVAREVDYLIIDTAGRLHTKVNLMQELEKIYRVIQKKLPSAPHEVLLVLDATTGQNALNQAKQFLEAAKITAIFLTKLDGTARGGMVLTINRELGIPVKYVGLGEKLEDMALFDSKEFAEGLFA